MTDLIVQLLSPKYIFFYFCNFLLAFGVLSLILKSSESRLKILYVPAGKSATNARLLGGLSLSIPFFTSLALLYLFNAHNTETRLLQLTLVPIILVTAYGFIDDKFEVRARIKLIMQIISVLGFCYLNKESINAEHPYIAFAMSSIIGLGLINGCNLLDGLDTMAIKVSIVTSLAFLAISIFAQSLPGALISGITISSLCAFYFFNKEPAKIYLGEIGGSILGLMFFFQANICYSKLHVTSGHLQTYSLILIASLIPLSELGISFTRRIWTKKSPFRGDRLHLHYILKSKLHLTATQTANKIALYSFGILASGLILSTLILPIFAFLTSFAVLASLYTVVCLKDWMKTKDVNQRKGLFNHIKIEAVQIINVRELSDVDSLDPMTADQNYLLPEDDQKIAA